jgi:hypothetical protein
MMVVTVEQLMEWISDGETEVLTENLPPLSLCPQRDLTWAWTRAAAAGSRQLTRVSYSSALKTS